MINHILLEETYILYIYIFRLSFTWVPYFIKSLNSVNVASRNQWVPESHSDKIPLMLILVNRGRWG